MIRFSKMADYGVLLLGHMARAGGRGESLDGDHESTVPTALATANDLLSATELAEALHMPRSVVSNLLKSFREAGLLESRRGLHGGYRMTRAPEDISLLTVLRAIDGPVQLTDCAAFELELATNCEYEDVCTSRSPLLDVNRRIIEMLDDMTLAGLQHAPLPTAPSQDAPATSATTSTQAT